jgi:hypothetical protein
MENKSFKEKITVNDEMMRELRMNDDERVENDEMMRELRMNDEMMRELRMNDETMRGMNEKNGSSLNIPDVV